MEWNLQNCFHTRTECDEEEPPCTICETTSGIYVQKAARQELTACDHCENWMHHQFAGMNKNK